MKNGTHVIYVKKFIFSGLIDMICVKKCLTDLLHRWNTLLKLGKMIISLAAMYLFTATLTNSCFLQKNYVTQFHIRSKLAIDVQRFTDT